MFWRRVLVMIWYKDCNCVRWVYMDINIAESTCIEVEQFKQSNKLILNPLCIVLFVCSFGVLPELYVYINWQLFHMGRSHISNLQTQNIQKKTKPNIFISVCLSIQINIYKGLTTINLICCPVICLERLDPSYYFKLLIKYILQLPCNSPLRSKQNNFKR